jgi:hypothetical protein
MLADFTKSHAPEHASDSTATGIPMRADPASFFYLQTPGLFNNTVCNAPDNAPATIISIPSNDSG